MLPDVFLHTESGSAFLEPPFQAALQMHKDRDGFKMIFQRQEIRREVTDCRGKLFRWNSSLRRGGTAARRGRDRLKGLVLSSPLIDVLGVLDLLCEVAKSEFKGILREFSAGFGCSQCVNPHPEAGNVSLGFAPCKFSKVIITS